MVTQQITKFNKELKEETTAHSENQFMTLDPPYKAALRMPKVNKTHD